MKLLFNCSVFKHEETIGCINSLKRKKNVCRTLNKIRKHFTQEFAEETSVASTYLRFLLRERPRQHQNQSLLTRLSFLYSYDQSSEH